jgi:putative spermidine/putrescine transport system substrate-binding protein
MGDGVPIDKVFPLDTTRAINSLNKIKDSAVFQSLGTITNLAAQQDIVAGDLNLARTETLQKSNVPIDYTWNQAIVDSDSLGIIKGAQNVENANKLMAYTMLPQTQLRVLDALGYTPTATAALGILTVDQLKNLAGTSYTLPTSLILNGAYYSTHYTENEKLFQNWLLSLS